MRLEPPYPFVIVNEEFLHIFIYKPFRILYDERERERERERSIDIGISESQVAGRQSDLEHPQLAGV